MNLPQIHSITKKALVALVGGFLLIFLLFHMTANLFILRHDDGAWYSAFCHFMGSNWVVKIVEIILLGVILLHVALTLWLAVTNRLARPTRYRQRQRTKTHTSSKLMVWTGILIFVCLILHFCDFYFVKIGWVKGEYMVEVEQIQDDEVSYLVQTSSQIQMAPSEVVASLEAQMAMYADQFSPDEQAEVQSNLASLRSAVPVADLIAQGSFSADRKWIRHIDYPGRQMLRQAMPDCGVEPDFYYMAREKFSHLHIVIAYLIFFFVIFMHLRHAFPSAFQSLGLNNYKYNTAIEVCGQVYTWLIVVGFALVPVLVYLGV